MHTDGTPDKHHAEVFCDHRYVERDEVNMSLLIILSSMSMSTVKDD